MIDIRVNGEEFASSLDVFCKAECQTAFVLTESFEVNAQGELAITFTAVVVSLIQITDEDPTEGEHKR